MRRLPDADEIVTNDGVLTEQTRLYLLQLQELIEGNTFLTLARYADLADLDDKIINPTEDLLAGIVDGQGLAIYKSGNWVLAADDTTLIS